ncbi:MAG TPA: WecB/TagA/CpsF family glycosyltransferase, partial [Pseudonocardiaceae bacterium]|nr:WecB/TagA/CpsF family glycosyltransferase [Pseudonocardiaceae bacterium]
MTLTDAPARLEVGGVGLCALTERDVVAAVRERWRAGQGGSIITVNVDILRTLSHDPDLRKLIADASLVVADGMPLVWAARLMGHPLPERVTGSSLVFSLADAAARDGRSIFLLGGARGVPEASADVLRARYPELRVVGALAPPFGFDATEDGMDHVVRAVRAAEPDLVLVGLGFPRQERTIERLRQALPQAWYLGCGAGIPMAAGQFRRAPALMQRLGLEWLHRLALEPRRLAGRYLRDDAPFALAMMVVALRARRRTAPPDDRLRGSALSAPVPGKEVRPLAVVIVTYASAGVVAGCLEALPAALEGAGDARVIVVDNASPDDTLDVVRRVAPQARIVRRA